MTVSPRVSVLMSVYNGARYLREAIDSILAQTFTDFEFIIVDDGSTDETPAILDSYTDPRIVRLRNETNIGLTKSLNRGLAIARGEYVARQDADDVSFPERIQKQVAFLDAHPIVAMVGSAYYQIDPYGALIGIVLLPCDHQAIADELLYHCCFCHGATIFRLNQVRQVGNYNEEFVVAQDWDLWVRLMQNYQLANLPDALYKLRCSSRSISVRSRESQRRAARHISETAMKFRLTFGKDRPVSALTMGRYYWHQALWALSEGDSLGVTSRLASAWRVNPLLREDARYLVQQLVDVVYDPRTGMIDDTNAVVHREIVAEGRRLIDHFFALIPDEAHALRSLHRRVIGELHAAYAFASYRAGCTNRVRYHVSRALWYDPPTPTRFNRGLISVLIRSVKRKIQVRRFVEPEARKTR